MNWKLSATNAFWRSARAFACMSGSFVKQMPRSCGEWQANQSSWQFNHQSSVAKGTEQMLFCFTFQVKKSNEKSTKETDSPSQQPAISPANGPLGHNRAGRSIKWTWQFATQATATLANQPPQMPQLRFWFAKKDRCRTSIHRALERRMKRTTRVTLYVQCAWERR